MSTTPERRDASAWARPVERLTASDGHINVTGRRPTAPMNGFGRMWQKTYRTRIGTAGSPLPQTAALPLEGAFPRVLAGRPPLLRAARGDRPRRGRCAGPRDARRAEAL